MMLSFCQMTIISLSEWIQSELERRGWSGNQLAVKADLDPGIISRTINKQRMPSPESLRAIGRAFGYPPEVVYRAAGLLPPIPENTEQREQLLHLFDILPADEKEDLLNYLQIKITMLERAGKITYGRGGGPA